MSSSSPLSSFSSSSPKPSPLSSWERSGAERNGSDGVRRGDWCGSDAEEVTDGRAEEEGSMGTGENERGQGGGGGGQWKHEAMYLLRWKEDRAVSGL
mmetsp:Transcript_2586/g.7757  ORF Transcript_2586/g.7757 Transcript_2586/m.7757 type:complete len:97 (-) Transcript_2586:1377-1667(-)